VNDEQVKEALAAALRARTEWEEKPGLYFVSSLTGVRERSIFDMWPDPPTHALPILADAFEDGASALASLRPSDFIGIAFRCEAWAVTSSKEEYDSPVMEVMRQDRLLHLHGNRVEQRMITAAILGGKCFMATQSRGSEEVVIHEGELTGRVPDSLRRITAALMAGVN